MKKKINLSASLLGKYSIFKGMSDAQIKNAADALRIATYEKEEIVWEEGTEGRDMCLLLEGEVAITQQLTLSPMFTETTPHDKSLINLKAEQRPVIGEIAICAKTPRSATISAVTDITLAFLSMKDLERLIDDDPHFGFLLFRNIASIIGHRLIRSNENIMKLTTAFSLALQHGR